MSHKRRLLAYADRFGGRLDEGASEVSLRGIECIVSGRRVGRCDIVVSVDEDTRQLLGVPTQAPHAAEIRLHGEHDGLVYDQHGARIENMLKTDGKTTCCLSIKLGGQTSPRDYEDAYHCLGHYAKVIVGAVHAMRNGERLHAEGASPDASLSAFESRTGLQTMQERVRGSSIAILGLGGTGSYILDLMIKTPVAHIHIFDDDALQEWNTYRSPGAPSKQDLETMRVEGMSKVHYYHGKYSAFKADVVVPHRTRAGAQQVAQFCDWGVSFAFVAIDPRDEKRQDEVYLALDEANIPFVDAGMNVRLANDRLSASLQVFSSYRLPKGAWRQAIPNARLCDEERRENPYRNSQIAELNALNAALAVIEWRKITEQFESSRDVDILRYKTCDARIVSRPSETK